MANKELTAKVKLDIKDAESKLERLNSLIKSINKAVTGHANTSQLEQSLTRQVIQAEKAKQATLKTAQQQERLTQEIGKSFIVEEKVTQAISKTAVEREKAKQAVSKTAQEVGKEYIVEERLNQVLQRGANIRRNTTVETNKTTNAVSNLNKELNRSNSSSSRLLGTMKRLASTYLGIMGMKAVTSTSDTITSTQNKLNALNGGNENLTQEQMDKMYVSSTKVRMDYTDMLANASKSMTLAGSAFKGNMDNAIRFQEIMAETYALGGASAPEMSTSMYQMIQALGSGTLQGDELRSVREGAPLAYQAIEQFAQGVYDTTDSLKDMASEGKITSDIVVAAIMDAGGRIDSQFKETAWTFEAVWKRIKSAAVKAFEPISAQLSEMLNKVANSGMFEKIELLFWNLAKVIQIVFALIEKTITWIGDNWNWLKYVVLFAVTAIVAYLAYMGYQAAVTAIKFAISWLTANSSLLLTIGIIALIVVALVWLANQCATVCDFIYQLCIGLAWAIVGVLAIVLVAYLATGAIMLSIPTLIALAVITVLLVIVAAFVKYTGEIVGGAYGIWEVFKNVINDIGVFFNNLWFNTVADFWNFVGAIISGLKDLEPAFNAIAELFGLEGVTLSGIITNIQDKEANARAKVKDYNGITAADAWKTGYEKGYQKGEDIQDSINGWKDKLSGFGLDGLGEKLGLDFGDSLPTLDDYQLTTDNFEGMANDVGDIKDSMELTNDELDYLRRLADMEWRNEFTTAEIRVDMTNNNTVNSERDLDGIVEYLSDVLRSEMTNVAYGTHY